MELGVDEVVLSGSLIWKVKNFFFLFFLASSLLLFFFPKKYQEILDHKRKHYCPVPSPVNQDGTFE